MREGISLRDPASRERQTALGGCETCPQLRSVLFAALADGDAPLPDEAELAARAGLTLEAFHEHYEDRDECLRDCFDRLADDLHAHFERGSAGSGDWHTRLAAGLDASLQRLQAIPGATRLWFLEVPQSSDPLLQEHRAAARDRLVTAITDPWDESPEQKVPGLHIEFLAGALARAGHDQLVVHGDGPRAVRRVRELLAQFAPLPA